MPNEMEYPAEELLNTLNVIHDENDQKFYVLLNGEEAFVSYALPDHGRIHFITTLVPFRYRGKGVAKILVKTALDYAERNNLAVSTSCWYIKNYLKTNNNKKS